MHLNPTSDTYDNLLLAYKFMNEHLFESTLPICLITLQREKNSYGYFCGNKFHNNDSSKKTDEIALNPQYFRSPGRDDMQVISTLVHEMAHLWQHHYGKPGRSRYHNKEWADKMVLIGLIPSSTGEAGGSTTGDHMGHYIDDNGPFVAAFRDLKVAGFALQWIEAQEIEQNTIEISSFPKTNIPPPLQRDDEINDNDENNESDYKTKENDDFENNKREYPPEIASPRKVVDKSKMKYSCPKCGINAWAKTGINLKCGDCEEYLIYKD